MKRKLIETTDAESGAISDIIGVSRVGGAGGVRGNKKAKSKGDSDVPRMNDNSSGDYAPSGSRSKIEKNPKTGEEEHFPEWSGKDPRAGKPSAEAESPKQEKKSSNLGKGIAATAAGAAAAVGLGSLAGSKVGKGIEKKSDDSNPDKETETSYPSRSKSTDEGTGPSVSMTSMKINKGDTLSAIAKRHGTTVKDLMDSNPDIKDANKIYAGKSLSLKKKPEDSQDGYKKGGSLRRSGGGGLGVGQALRGWGAVRKK